jgi:transmembrane 9 superfamily protein 3
MYADDLPIWGIVGEYDEKEDAYYLWTHKKFEFGYNEDRVVDVNLTSEAKVKLSPGLTIHCSYEVIKQFFLDK